MIIRPATLFDLDSIMNVETHSFISQIQEDRKVFEQRILRCPQFFLVFVDEKSNIVAGYICAEAMEKIPSTAEELKLGHLPEVFDIKNLSSFYIYISSFAILPEYRGNGNGKNMWQKSLSYFENKGFSKFLLLVNEIWQGAKHIYEANGFEKFCIFENFFPAEDDKKSSGILMIKNK